MKKILTIIICLSFNFIIGQEINLIKIGKYHCAIFSKKHELPNSKLPIEKRFTPNQEEIKLFEKQLHKELKKFKNDNPNKRKSKKQIIYKNLKKYRRQYLGIINKSGRKLFLLIFYGKSISFQILNGKKKKSIALGKENGNLFLILETKIGMRNIT
jgi:hypothetical protein